MGADVASLRKDMVRLQQDVDQGLELMLDDDQRVAQLMEDILKAMIKRTDIREICPSENRTLFLDLLQDPEMGSTAAATLATALRFAHQSAVLENRKRRLGAIDEEGDQ